MGKSFWVAVLFVFTVRQAMAGPTVDLQLVTGGVTNPVFVTHAGDGSGRLFIVEQGGRIKVFTGTALLPQPFLDISGQINSSGEQGLLSVAFHPGFRTNGHFYVYYTNPSGSSNVVARFTASPPTANAVDANTQTNVLRIAHPGNDNHNGGQLQFGPDGYLYIATGDGGSGCDPPNNAQNLGSVLGKMLRLDVSDFSTNYTIPPSNPFVSTGGARPEIWAYGLRNPWRFSFDRVTGDLFIGDVGQDTREEIDFQAAGSPGGQNYGWRLYEGFCTNCCSVTFSNIPATFPIIDYDHSFGRSVTGGYPYRGHAITPLFGAYLYADYFSPGPISFATNGGSAWFTNKLMNAGFNISSFGEDQDGEIYVCRHGSNPDGIYRLKWRDTDGDGMADDWENQYGLNPNNAADATIDTDGDGMLNRQEFLSGTNPTNANDLLRITGIQRLNSTNVLVSFTSNFGKNYNLERSTNLSPSAWSVVATNVAGTGGIMQVTNILAHPTAPQRFYRVRLAQGNTAAADDASDPSYAGGWTTGSNGGTGFSSWTLTGSGVLGSGTNGYFIGSSLNNAANAGPSIDVAGKSWGSYANGGNFTTAYRAFASGPVAVGQTFFLNLDSGLVDAGQSVGFTIRTGNAASSYTDYNTGARFEFSFIGSSANYTVTDAAGARDTGVPFTGTGLRLAFTLTGADTYSLLITDNATGVTATMTGTLAGSGSLDSFALYNRNAGGTSARDVFFNGLRVSLPASP